MMMCAAGDAHGALERLYDSVIEFERALGIERFDHVLHVGDFGIWPDPTRVDRATRDHGGAGDFPRWLAEGRIVPRQTTFIKGNHEDFDWLDSFCKREKSGERRLETTSVVEILDGLQHLRNGHVVDVTVYRDGRQETARVAGVGGCFGPSDFERQSKNLQSRAKRHYTRDEIEAINSSQRVDILLTHDAPAGVVFPRHRRGFNWKSDAAGLDELLKRIRPRVCFFGHHHIRVDATVDGVKCIGLNKVGCPGNLVAFEFVPQSGELLIIDEWPSRRSPTATNVSH